MRRGWTRPVTCFCLCIALGGLTPAAVRPACAETYGLVVGINDYIGETNDLDGAVDDAKDIAASLDKAGAKEVVRLLDGDATKAAIEAAWRRLVTTAKSGDTVVFSYAGHGGQEPEPPGRRDEPDGMNENFMLGGYEPDGAGTKERIVDDEVFGWLEEADAKGVKVIFVADACHSGSMNRGARAEGVKFRNAKFAPITDDELDFPSPAISKLTEDDLENVTFVAAVPEDKLAPEIPIDGHPRGALSWAFSRALEGGADKNGDGVIDQLELLSFLVPAVHAQVESQQTPQVRPLRARSVELFGARPGGGATATAEAAPLNVAVKGGDGGLLRNLPFVKLVTDARTADLVWDRSAGTVEHRVGGVVAEHVGPDEMLGVAAKWGAIVLLNGFAARAPVGAEVTSGNQRYGRGQLVRVGIKGAEYPHLTLFNLPPDGRVEFFIPDPRNPRDAAKDWSAEPFSEQFRVDKPPFGAEHMVAIYSKEPLGSLHAALAAMGRGKDAQALRAALEQALKGQQAQVGVLDIYTGAE